MSDNFWARKLGASSGAPASAPFRKSNELYPLYTSPTVEQGAVPSQQMAVPQGQVPQEEYRPTVRMKQGQICPGCKGDKYFSPLPNYMPTCGDCGFNPRFEQSGYGQRSLKTEPGQAKAAVQVAGGQTMQASLAVLQAGGGEHI